MNLTKISFRSTGLVDSSSFDNVVVMKFKAIAVITRFLIVNSALALEIYFYFLNFQNRSCSEIHLHFETKHTFTPNIIYLIMLF